MTKTNGRRPESRQEPKMTSMQWFAVRKELRPRPRFLLGIMSFLLPLLVWSLFSYVPWIWHPMVEIRDPGAVSYFQVNSLVDRATFEQERAAMEAAGQAQPQGRLANPVYLPAPHEVATALLHRLHHRALAAQRALAARKPVEQHPGDLLGLRDFVQLIGVPLGILCGTFRCVQRGCTSPSSNSSATCRRPPSAPSRSPSSASTRRRRSPSSSSAPSSSRSWSCPTPRASWTRRCWRRRRPWAPRDLALLFRVVVPGMLPDIYKRPAHPARLGVDLPDRRRSDRHQFRHHLVHQPAGALQELRQRLRRHPDHRPHRAGHRPDPGAARRALFPWNARRLGPVFRFLREPGMHRTFWNPLPASYREPVPRRAPNASRGSRSARWCWT
jgi:hypothetical protein